MNKTIISFLVFFSSMTTCNAFSAEFAISPMLIELKSEPGSRQDFTFQIHGKQQGTARIFLSEMQQEPSGHMAFIEPNTEETNQKNITNWISLNNTRVIVKQGETVSINGSIEIPRRTTGSHEIAIMVEEEKEEASSGISLNVRYAIILALDINGRKTRIKTKYEKLIVEEQNGQRFVSAWFTNLSNRDSYLDATVLVRDEDRRLLAKVPLRTKSAWQREDTASRVFPGSRVKVYGLLSNNMPSGNYELTSKNRFAGKLQRSTKNTVFINSMKEGVDQKTSTKNSKSPQFLINPVAMKVTKSGRAFSAIKFKNPTSTPIEIVLPTHSKEDKVQYQFSPRTLKLAASASAFVTLRQTFSKSDIAPQTYTAQVTSEDTTIDLFIETTL